MTELSPLQQSMISELRFIGDTCTRKYYGVYFKCTKTGINRHHWFAEGSPIRVDVMARATMEPEQKV